MGVFDDLSSPQESRRQDLWKKLGDYVESTMYPWKLGDDFNETVFIGERQNCSEDLSRRCNNFLHWINNHCIIDLAFSGPQFTWSWGKSIHVRKAACLDRGLCNDLWRMEFQEVVVRHLLQNQYDHCPLLIGPNGFAPISIVKHPFRFQVAWRSDEKFKGCLRENWRSHAPLYPLLH